MPAKRFSNIEISGIRKMFEGAPPDAINLGLGEPDFQPPECVLNALQNAVKNGFNKYGPIGGIPELRSEIAAKYNQIASTKSENVIITDGATEALFATVLALIDEGDEVLIPDPGFPLYESHVRICGGVPVFYSLSQKNDFIPDVNELETLITPKTKAIIVNSPSNPTGGVIPAKTVEEIGTLAKNTNIVVISDEVYDHILYDAKHETFWGRCDNAVIINSFSKTYAMTGWRIGFLVAPSQLLPHIFKSHYHLIACPPTPTQYAALEALLNANEDIARMVNEFRKRRDYIAGALNSIPGFNCLVPKGAFYVFPEFNLPRTSMELATKLVQHGVICTPGSAFGRNGERHIRFSYANSLENIKRAIERVRAVIETLS
ncbi:MAG: pyridoxal phosphate-dependent aminotransferase [Thermoplasmata archaeon]|nr:pyridoxal phosphate-dependent aminotransferase [Thermoplasmata archaeon]